MDINEIVNLLNTYGQVLRELDDGYIKRSKWITNTEGTLVLEFRGFHSNYETAIKAAKAEIERAGELEEFNAALEAGE